MINKPELLAPAGNSECLKAAILGGADAIYLAGKRFGARAFADNFNEEMLWWARRVTRAHNKKLYITLNTLVFDYEWQLLEDALDFYETLQPDSLIVQDLGIAAELKRRNSKIPLHLSTQGTWFGQGGEKLLSELGFTRIILPRETTKQEIAQIVKNYKFEIETFVHGAMCYSISGKCYWSSELGTRSGNRGTCAQPCRKEYYLENGTKGFLFSPKDLRLIEKVQELSKIGVSSLKIEGRMKSAEYVYRVVSQYRKALDNETSNKTSLSEVFSRANSIGFFDGIPNPNKWKTGKTSGREGVVVAITTGRIQNGLIEVKLKFPINLGDGLVWIHNGIQNGSKVTWLKTDKKDIAWLRGLPSNIAPNTELCRTSSGDEGNWIKKWDSSSERQPIEIFWSGKENTPIKAECKINNKIIDICSEETLSKAQKSGLEDGPIQNKFSIFENNFIVKNHNFCQLEKKLYLSAIELKELKRNFYIKLKNTENTQKNKLPPINYPKLFTEKNKRFLRIKIFNKNFPFNSDIENIDQWILPWNTDRHNISKINCKKIAFWLPPILNKEQFLTIQNYLSKIKSGNFTCFGWEAFKLAEIFPNLSFNFDWNFNISNLSSLNLVRNNGLDATFSKEWRMEEIPENLIGIRYLTAWNPLVSFTRFPKAISEKSIANNSHNDKFFTIDIGNGVTAMFLEQKPKKHKIPYNAGFQIDIALMEKENPAKVFSFLSEISK